MNQNKSSCPPLHSKKLPSKSQNSTEFLWPVKYTNTLPDIPLPAKFLPFPFENKRFENYKVTSLERNYRSESYFGSKLHLKIDLKDDSNFVADPKTGLSKEDLILLEEENVPAQSQQQLSEPWLRKSEFISSETNIRHSQTDQAETKVGYKFKKILEKEDMLIDSQQTQIQAIEKTFEDAKIPITKHLRKPNVVPIEVLPMFPDFENMKYEWCQYLIDSGTLRKEMEESILEHKDEELAKYFLPTPETTLKRTRDTEEGLPYLQSDDYIYKLDREYKRLRIDKTVGQHFIFAEKSDMVLYTPLETREKLIKNKLSQEARNTSLILKHRPFSKRELKLQQHKLSAYDQEIPILEESSEEEEEQMPKSLENVSEHGSINGELQPSSAYEMLEGMNKNEAEESSDESSEDEDDSIEQAKIEDEPIDDQVESDKEISSQSDFSDENETNETKASNRDLRQYDENVSNEIEMKKYSDSMSDDSSSESDSE